MTRSFDIEVESGKLPLKSMSSHERKDLYSACLMQKTWLFAHNYAKSMEKGSDKASGTYPLIEIMRCRIQIIS